MVRWRIFNLGYHLLKPMPDGTTLPDSPHCLVIAKMLESVLTNKSLLLHQGFERREIMKFGQFEWRSHSSKFCCLGPGMSLFSFLRPDDQQLN